MLYRIYTENKNRARILELTSARFQGYNVQEATGVWRGAQEASLILEVWSDDPEASAQVYSLAQEIKRENAQEAILVLSYKVDGELV